VSAPRVALVTYSTKPRGGVVHTLSLAEALVAQGTDVRVVALGRPDGGFFREVAAPVTHIPAPEPLPTLEERVFASVDALEIGMRDLAGEFDILHTQDCISARAAARVRDAGAPVKVLRTVHHVDDFTTQALIDCQRQAILEPDRLLVVSEDWHGRLRREYAVESTVVHNGVDRTRFGPIDAQARHGIRHEHGVDDAFVFLAVGGIEPRKGTTHLFRALAELAHDGGTRPVVVIVGGHSFQDYAEYREKALVMLGELGLELGRDVITAGTLTDEQLHQWYRSADALAFPSVKEGWGLVVMEAMCAELPVVARDIPVLREYLTDGTDAVLTAVGDPHSLAEGMRAVMRDAELRRRLVAGGNAVVGRYTWDATARVHAGIYASMLD